MVPQRYLPLRISSNERPKEFVDGVRRVVGEDETVVGALPCADFAVGDVAGIERKRVGNLASSLVKVVHKDTDREDKELWDQLGRCLSTYGTTYLLIEGMLTAGPDPSSCYTDYRYRRVPYLAVQAAIDKAQLSGAHVLWTGDWEETALVLRWLHRRYR